jgi:hypothetical protein
MTEELSRSVIAPVQGSGKPRDVTIFVSVGLFAIGLIIVLCSNSLSTSIEPVNLDLVNAYP